MKKLKIDWLDPCPECDDSVHTVHTKEGSEKWLYDGDKVTCDCGQTGEIECDDGVAWVNWGKNIDEKDGLSMKLPFEVTQSLREVP